MIYSWMSRDVEQMWPMFDTNGYPFLFVGRPIDGVPHVVNVWDECRDGVIDLKEFANLVQRQIRQDQATGLLNSD